MSDTQDPSGGIPRRIPRNEPAQVAGGVAIVLAVVAVVAGFLILRSISSSDDAVIGSPVDTAAIESTTTVDPAATATTIAEPTTTTIAGPVTAGASVIVANANGVSGSAGLLSDELAGVGYSMGSPTNASASIGGTLEQTVVYYDTGIPAAQAVAESVAESLGGVSSIAPVQTPAPTQTGSLDGAGVLVMLGLDKAGRTLAELAPAAVTEVQAGVTESSTG
ncbi:MAG: LytR C-terminal domain-containing protein [Actinomycetota bacterium]|nr:LytR C-terminal domain-containing protein [Actinomycetota bacterium]